MQVGRDVSASLPGLAGNATGSSPASGGEGYSMLEGLRGDINNGAELNALARTHDADVGSLNADQALARNMPRTMVSDAYGALMDFNRMNLGASSGGMNQFYDFARESQENNNRPGQAIPTGSLLEALAGGYSDSANRIGTVQTDMNSGWSDNKGMYNSSVAGVNDLFNRSIGSIGVFRNKSQIQQDEWAMEDAARERSKRERERALAEVANSPYAGVQRRQSTFRNFM
jgi:hypothetical protein